MNQPENERPGQSPSSSRVAVIGGGISGLAAAAYLAEFLPHAAIDIYEASSQPGGVLRTESIGGFLIEQAADNFATQEDQVADLHRTLRLDVPLIRPNELYRLAKVLYGARLHAIPQGFSLLQPTRLASVFTSSLFSPAAKLRIAAEQFVPARRDDSDESLESFATRRLGHEAFERLIEPVVCGIFTARADRLSMRAALPQFVRMEQEHGSLIRAARVSRKKTATAVEESAVNRSAADAARMASGARYDIFQAPQAGMSDWVRRIVGSLPPRVRVLCNHQVETLSELPGSRWRVAARSGAAAEYDGCVVAANAPQAAALLQQVVPEVATELAAIDYAGSAIAALELDAAGVAETDRCFGIVSPSASGSPLLAVSFSSLKYSGRAPSGKVLLRVFLGGAVHPEVETWSDSEVASFAASTVANMLKLPAKPSCLAVYRWAAAMPQYELGHLDRLSRIDGVLETLPTLRLCGNFGRGVGIPQCIASGRSAADSIAAAIKVSHRRGD